MVRTTRAQPIPQKMLASCQKSISVPVVIGYRNEDFTRESTSVQVRIKLPVVQAGERRAIVLAKQNVANLLGCINRVLDPPRVGKNVVGVRIKTITTVRRFIDISSGHVAGLTEVECVFHLAQRVIQIYRNVKRQLSGCATLQS